MTLLELASHLRVTRRTLMRWIKLGMPTHQPFGPGGNHFAYLTEVNEWIKSRCSAQTPGQRDVA